MDITITQLAISQNCAVYKVCLTGTLSQKTIGKFQKAFLHSLPQDQNILIDFSQATIEGVKTIKIVIETLICQAEMLIEKGKALVVFGLKNQDAQQMQRFLGIGIENVLPIFSTEDEAIVYLSRDPGDTVSDEDDLLALEQGKVQWILPEGNCIRGKLALLKENKISYVLFSNPAVKLSEVTDRYVEIPISKIQNVTKKGFFIWQTMTIHVKPCVGMTEYVFRGNLGRMGDIIEFEVRNFQV